MEIIVQFLLFSIFFSISTQSSDSCKPESCHSSLGPEVRFPFRLSTRKPVRCGYPGFEFFCNRKKETILKLPVSGEFRVNSIDYSSQIISISDPGSCLPSRILNLNLSGSPFRGAYVRNYTFFNCSYGLEELTANASDFRYDPVSCFSGRNYTVLITPSFLSPDEVPPMCLPVANVSVPVKWTSPMSYWPPTGSRALEEIDLLWSDPSCSYCEKHGRICRFKDDSSLEIGCYKRATSSGMSRKAKYGIIIGVGIPGLVCIVGLICHICGLIRSLCRRRDQNSELSTVTVPDVGELVTNGLDEPTIESYPKTVLGESRRLPESSDGACPICLSEYQPKDTLRSIPECNHYFHVDCIDEWLKLNGTCPLCRNSPDGSTTTPSCSSSSSSSITPSSTPSSSNL